MDCAVDLSFSEYRAPLPVRVLSSFVPNKATLYVIVNCSGRKTLALTHDLYANHGIHAFAPMITHKGKLKPALPGFVFIPEQEYTQAEQCARQYLVPDFSPLVVAATIQTCSHSELVIFQEAVNNVKIDLDEFTCGLNVGDQVYVKSGPFADMEGTVESFHIAETLFASLTIGKWSKIRMPISVLGIPGA